MSVLEPAEIITAQAAPARFQSVKQGEILFLDGLRGLAALFVVIHHASYLLQRSYFVQMKSFGRISPAKLHPAAYQLLNLLLVPFQFGHLAVVLFFVLSGFVIHLRYAADLQKNPLSAQFGWSRFVWRRARRIYPPLLLAVLLSSVLYAIGIHYFPVIYRSDTAYVWIDGAVLQNHEWQTLLGNLAFVMPVYVHVWSGNGPLWSLGYEWWFYMLYPLFWWLSKKGIKIATTIFLIIFTASFFPSIWPFEFPRLVLGVMMTWWLGALLADVYVGRIRIAWESLIPLTGFLGLFPIRALPDQAKSFIVGLGFCGLLSFCFWLRSNKSRYLRWLDQLRPLGDMSYTLYVTHMPILTLIAGIFIFKSSNSPLPDSPVLMVLGIVIAMIFAWYAHLFVELPFVKKAKSATH